MWYSQCSQTPLRISGMPLVWMKLGKQMQISSFSKAHLMIQSVPPDDEHFVCHMNMMSAIFRKVNELHYHLRFSCFSLKILHSEGINVFGNTPKWLRSILIFWLKKKVNLKTEVNKSFNTFMLNDLLCTGIVFIRQITNNNNRVWVGIQDWPS